MDLIRTYLADQDEIFVRASFSWDANERLNLLLQSDYLDLDEGGAMEKLLQPGGLLTDPDNTLPITPSLVAGLGSGAVEPADAGGGPTFVPGVIVGYNELLGYTMGSPYENHSDIDTYNDTSVGGIALTLTWDPSDAVSVKSITGYREWESERLLDMDGSPYAHLHPLTAVDAEIITQELQFNYSTTATDWVFGAYCSDEEGVDGSRSIILAPLNPSRSINDGTVRNLSIGAYAQATYRMTEAVSLTAGLRYTEEEKKLESRNRIELAAVPGMVIGCTVPPGDRPITACVNNLSDSFDDPSWLVSLDYDLADDIMVYASVASSWRGGGQNLRASGDSAAAQPFAPETATNYELGLKGDYLDSTLHINAAVFLTDYQDIQRSIIVPSSSGESGNNNVVTVLTNAAEADIFGAEIELWYQPSEEFSFFSTFGYIDFEYQDFISLAPDGVSIIDRSDEEVALPDLQASFSARYDRPLTGNRALGVQLDYVWQDDRNITPISRRPDVTTQESFGRLNARLELEFGERYVLSLWGKNLTDESFLAGGTDFTGNALAHTIGVIGRPRTYGVTLAVDFGDS